MGFIFAPLLFFQDNDDSSLSIEQMTAIQKTRNQSLSQEERHWEEFDRKYKLALKEVVARMEEIPKQQNIPVFDEDLQNIRSWIQEIGNLRLDQQVRYETSVLHIHENRRKITVSSRVLDDLVDQCSEQLMDKFGSTIVCEKSDDLSDIFRKANSLKLPPGVQRSNVTFSPKE